MQTGKIRKGLPTFRKKGNRLQPIASESKLLVPEKPGSDLSEQLPEATSGE